MPAATHQLSPAPPDFVARVESGYLPALEACRDLLRARIDTGVPARELAPLASVARQVDSLIRAHAEGQEAEG